MNIKVNVIFQLGPWKQLNEPLVIYYNIYACPRDGLSATFHDLIFTMSIGINCITSVWIRFIGV